MTPEQIHDAARARLLDAKDIGALESNWEEAYGYYKGEKPEAFEAFTSEAVSTDVSDVVEWFLPAVIKPLVESPDVVRFDPVNPEDAEQAALESDYVHHTFLKKCNGFTKLYVHIKDALLLKNAVWCAYWDESKRHRKESYVNLTEYELGELLSPADGSEVRIVESKGHEEPIFDIQTQGSIAGLQGQEGQGQEAPTHTLYDVTVRRLWTQGRPVVENCRMEDFRVNSDHNDINLEDARFISYKVRKTESELTALRYEKARIEEIRELTQDDSSVAWDRDTAEMFGGDLNPTEDTSQNVYPIQRCYMRLDVDEDRLDEQYHIVLGGDDGEVLLDWYEIPENPFAASTPFIMGHQFWGISLYDKLKAIADAKTKFMRMLEDNLDLQNDPRKIALRGACNLDDLFSAKVGGVWRVDQPDAINLVPTPQIQQQAQQSLDYYDKKRGERSGMDPNAQGITAKLPEESMNTAVERVLSMKEEMTGLVIRVFCETGIKQLFLKLRGLLMRHQNKA
jgi:hypothetical protein